MSKLIVEICRISKIEPIPNADKIVLATIKGWQCIIQKDAFKENDLAIFIPPDAVIPEKMILEQKLTFLKKGRVDTIKLKGVISQGLVLPCSILEKYDEYCYGKNDLNEGDNVADLLGIVKYEPIELTEPHQYKKETLSDVLLELVHGKINIRRFVFKIVGLIKIYFKPKKKTNPFFDKYTDIENIKHFPNVFEEGESVIITEKTHGSSGRWSLLPKKSTNVIDKIINKITGEYEFCYGSHNIQKHFTNIHAGYYKDDIWNKITKKYNLDIRLPKDYIFYGEVYGKGVQDLTYGLNVIDVRFFDIKNVKTGKYVDADIFIEMCRLLSLPTVPILYYGKYSTEELKAHTSGNSVICLTQIREGCVVKPLKEQNHPKIGRKILKSISTDYLTRKNGTEYH